MKGYKKIIIINLIITFVIVATSAMYVSSDYLAYEKTPINREQILMILNIICQIFIAISAIIALTTYFRSVKWKKNEGLELFLELQEKNSKNILFVKTFVKNKSKKHIFIKDAYLELREHDSGKYVQRIDLNYYTHHNIRVSNEKLKYIKPIPVIGESKNEILYDVWFYIHTQKGLYRNIQSCFKAELNLNNEPIEKSILNK